MGARLEQEGSPLTPEWQEVERYVRAHPEYAAIVLDYIEKLDTARERGWVGKLETNIVTGEVRGKIVVKAA